MQPFSDILQHWEFMPNHLFYFGDDVLHVLPRVFTWISNSIASDLLLIVLFCIGFCLFRAAFVRDLITSLICRDAEKNLTEDTESISNVSTSHVESDKDSLYEADFRPRCPALVAQTAGLPPDMPETCMTVVLKNIPTTYTPDKLLAALHECGYFGDIDFVYVPVDFKRRDRGLGFAVVNFNSFSACLKFSAEFHLANICDKLSDEDVPQVLEVAAALIQGSKENIRHLQKSPVPAWLAKYPAWRPQVINGGLAMPLKAMRSSDRPRRMRMPRV